MRLLQVSNLQFHNVPSHGPFPDYAILSHTWISPNDEEVTFQEISEAPSNRTFAKMGWDKILHTIKQAKEEGLEYVWIDTCCINKMDPTELTEAINCMFNWYRMAHVCYVYLSDIDVGNSGATDYRSPSRPATSKSRYQGNWGPNYVGPFIKTILRQCQWITRGWTLQELIAPPEVKIFDRQWQYLTSRAHSSDVISAATGIDQSLLKYQAGSAPNATRCGVGRSELERYSVAQKLSWAAKRRTTRAEDRVYSLFGLFSIIMPTHYGEGAENAFARLQQEIIRVTPDQSIFAFTRLARSTSIQEAEEESHTPFLAESPDWFQSKGDVVPDESSRRTAFSLNNVGLEIEAHIFEYGTQSKQSTLDWFRSLYSNPMPQGVRSFPFLARGQKRNRYLPKMIRNQAKVEDWIEGVHVVPGVHGLRLDCRSISDPSNVFVLPLRHVVDDKYVLAGRERCEEYDYVELNAHLKTFGRKLERKRITILRSTPPTFNNENQDFGPQAAKVRLKDTRPAPYILAHRRLEATHFTPSDNWRREDTFFTPTTQSHASGAICIEYDRRPDHDELPACALIAFSYDSKGSVALQICKGHDMPAAELVTLKANIETIRGKSSKELRRSMRPDRYTEIVVMMSKVFNMGQYYWDIEVTVKALGRR